MAEPFRFLDSTGANSTCLEFLASYPHPAFIIVASTPETGQHSPSLDLVYANRPFYHLFYHTVGQTLHHFTDAFRNASQKEKFRQWILSDIEKPGFALEVNGPSGVLPIDVIKTRLQDVWVCTTVPRIAYTYEEYHPPPEQLVKEEIFTFTPSTSHNDPLVPVEQIVKTLDWGSTLVGPTESWPQSLKTAFGMMMSSPFPSTLGWGKELTFMYNDAYATLMAGERHPHIFGMRVKDAWPEIWDFLQPCFQSVFEGETVSQSNDLMFLRKLTEARLPQEFYISWHQVPIPQEDGTIGGYMLFSYESTEEVIGSRRGKGFYDLATETVLATSVSQYSESIIRVLSKEAYASDIPFALLYVSSPDSTNEPTHTPPASTVTYKLTGTIAIHAGHSLAPNTASVWLDEMEASSHQSSLTNGTMETTSPLLPESRSKPKSMTSKPNSTERGGINPPWPFAQAIKTRGIVHVEHIEESAAQDFERRGWGDLPRQAVVIPIGCGDQSVPAALLVLGVNTRLPYDSTYRGHADILRMMLSSTLHATLARQAEVERARQLAKLDAAKTTFFSNVSHELRTPLTLIGGPLELCISHAPDGASKEQLKIAQRNVHRLTRLVDSLMDFSKLSAHRLEGRFQPVQLGVFTSDLASLFQNLVETSGLKYDVCCDTDPSQPVCYVDPELWEKIVFNLVGNAFKFTLDGFIKVSVTHDSKSAIFAVQDSGIGIPKEDLPKIFHRFHRSQTTSRCYEGTGIGLSMAKELVTIHGGELFVESSNDPNGVHGSTFTVVMPLGKDHLPQECIYEPTSQGAHPATYARGMIEEASMWNKQLSICDAIENTAALDPSESGSNSSTQLDPGILFFADTDVVLLVDDNADMRKYIASILSRYCIVVEACNGQEALDIAVTRKPNVVLSDVMMPGMDGFGLLKELRTRKETSLIPIILVTARAGDESRVEGLLSGADDYLCKPFRGSELVARVHLQMQLGKWRVQMEEKFAQRTHEMQQLSEMSPVAIFRVDNTGKIVYVNPRWYDITGHSRNDDPDNWPKSVHPEDMDAVLSWWSTSSRSLVPPTAIEFRWNNGNWCQGQWVSVDNGIVGVWTDINERKELEAVRLASALEREDASRQRAEEAEKRRREADERRRSQELLIDVTSHELRQPVSAILNCCSMIRDNLSSLRDTLAEGQGTFRATPTLLQTMQEDLNALDAIYQCGLAQERIANDVLSLSRIQLGAFSIQSSEFNLVNEVHRIVSLFRNEAKMKRIRMSTTFGPLLERLGASAISTDKTRFSQVITNLLSNAIKFTTMSSNERRIVINVDIGLNSPNGDSCEPPTVNYLPSNLNISPDTPLFIFVSVKDSGPGLDPDDLALLFKRFQQGSNSHHIFGGSGLGLFVSRLLCELMGGRIEVCSVLGQGATFKFFIKATAAGSLVSEPASPSGFSKSTEGVNAPLRVLVTEDNQINQTILNRQLRKAGFVTNLADNGQEALDIIRSSDEPFDVILMDVEMPVLDGLSTIREIRKMEASGQLSRRNRVIALTGNAREGQVESILQAGMDEVMIKPYNFAEILAKLRPRSV